LSACATYWRSSRPSNAIWDCGRRRFEQDELLQGWFVRNLQIIGEAARSVPDDVRSLAPEIEWTKIVGMRNVLVHGYFDVDVDVVWYTACVDAVALKPKVSRLIERLERSP
jgi:uncharacterized protein with HEPN domain